MLLGYAYYKRISINRKQFMQRIIKREFSDFEKYKDSKAKEILSLSFLPVCPIESAMYAHRYVS